ncbi:transcription factor BIM2-like [Dioscorea cayenensis subsp. rotundata]|uniref:Transcription factor BIM2-like n=1 Tax=Dioscorea cayennensis subsp. rotundata TaxID=55577 RepID=A0AB40BUB3_DIOCR|nr:transcription factor BIM2-like [Dioscorea cayenensis subsp. rotundata]XP_039131040.1 transcription factor BIM2-like [Dioscorea cayenensis subsp. rotundata]XP_039131041.1 transcription factor BIM2-like [Dioscorea cayenensis subsp. rotundata]
MLSRSSDDDEDFGKQDGDASHKVGLTGKMDRRSTDPNTPRSKHSATEQRRRSKINDRFQKLRELIPCSDQKRDKASFLFEVIEYIRFLQDKVQKYEASCPEWNQENAWEKVYFRSIWKNAQQNNSQGAVDDITDPAQVLKNGSAASPGFVLSGRFDDSNIPVVPAMVSNTHTHNPSDSDNIAADVSFKQMENPHVAGLAVPLQPNMYAAVGNETLVSQTQQRLIPDGDDFASQSHSQLDCAVSSDLLNEQEELTIDEGTIAVSGVYSRGVLSSLTQSLQSSGVDVTQTSISVHINLGKRLLTMRPSMAPTVISTKDHDDPSTDHRAIGHSMAGFSGEESVRMNKKPRLDNR